MDCLIKHKNSNPFTFWSIVIVIAIIIFIYFCKEILTEYSSACQGLGALANLGLVYFIYQLSRNDSITDFEKEANRKWYLDIIIPKFTEQVDVHIRDQEEELNRISKKNNRNKLRQKIISYNYEEKELLNNIVYFDKKLYDRINATIDDFYDGVLDEMANSKNTVNWHTKYIKKLKEHKNDIFFHTLQLSKDNLICQRITEV